MAKNVTSDSSGKLLKGAYCELSITVHVVSGDDRYRAGNAQLDLSKPETTALLETLGVEIDLKKPQPEKEGP